MVAALTEDHKCLTVALVKATESEQKFEVNLTGVRMAGPSTRWQLGRSGLDAENRIDQPQLVEVREIPMGEAQGTISVAPATVNIYRLTVSGTTTICVQPSLLPAQNDYVENDGDK